MPLLGRQVEERPDLRPPRVVDQAVEAPEAFDDLCHEPLGLDAVREIGLERLAVRAGAPHPGQRRQRPVGGAVIVHRDGGPGGPGLGGDLRPDAAAAAGDQHDPAGQGLPHQASPAAASAARIAAVPSSDTGISGGRMTVLSMTPSSRSATLVRAR